jgi:PAS domain S-box-containing protein
VNSDQLVAHAGDLTVLVERLLKSESARIAPGSGVARAFLIEPSGICLLLSSLGEGSNENDTILRELALRCCRTKGPLMSSDQRALAVPLPAVDALCVVVTFSLSQGESHVLHQLTSSIQNWSENVQAVLVKHLEYQADYISRDAVRDSPASMIAVNGAGTVVLFNGAAESLFGYSAAEVLGTYVARLYESEEEARKVGRALKHSPIGSVSNIEVRVRCKNDTVVPINLSAKLYTDHLGQKIGSFSIFHDSRVLKQLYDLQATTEFYQNLIIDLPDPTILLDCEGNIEIFNTAAAELFDCVPEDVLRGPITQFYADPHEAREVGRRLRRAPYRVRNLEALTKSRMGYPIPVSLSARGLRDSSGEYIGSIGVFKDLRSIRHAERLAAFESFATSTSHKLKGSLQRAVLALDRLKRIDLSPKGHKLVETALQTITEASQEAQNLSFSGSSPQAPLRECISLGAIETDTHRRLLYTALASDVEFRTSSSDPLAQVEVDPRQIFQLTHNFFQNSLDALLEKQLAGAFDAVITMRLSEDAGALAMEWSDNGIGIPSEDLQQIFDSSFSRKKSQPASGLGLAIVRGIVDRHGGQIDVTSEVGKFTTFKLTLPCGREQRKQPELQGDGAMAEFSVLEAQYESIDYSKLVTLQEIDDNPAREYSCSKGSSASVETSVGDEVATRRSYASVDVGGPEAHHV